MKFKLADLCDYAREKITIEEVDERSYISTENLLPNKNGVTVASSVPNVKYAKFFKVGDVLVSNIRPYFRKIWYAAFDGGCSNDVLVFRSKSTVSSRFLYYVLADDKFFNYATATSKGTKMPRGDIKAIMEYSVPDIPHDAQIKIAELLSVIDDKIASNRAINKNLEEQAQAIFDEIISFSSTEKCFLSDIANINPKRQLPKGTVARCVDMSQLSATSCCPVGWEFKSFNGGMKFCNGDTLLARITPCLENGKKAYINFLQENEIAFGSTEYIVISPKEAYPAEFFYCLVNDSAFADYAVKNLNGSSGRQRVSAKVIGQYRLPKISTERFSYFSGIASSSFTVIRNNFYENIRLAALRDALLPRLMSGELDVSNIEL